MSTKKRRYEIQVYDVDPVYGEGWYTVETHGSALKAENRAYLLGGRVRVIPVRKTSGRNSKPARDPGSKLTARASHWIYLVEEMGSHRQGSAAYRKADSAAASVWGMMTKREQDQAVRWIRGR